MAFSTIATIPKVGFGLGTAFFKGYKHAVDDSPLIQSVIDQAVVAVVGGFRHLDLAETYGNDREVAVALKQFYDSNSTVTRRDLWITSKIADSISDVKGGCRAILDRLGCEYLDLLLLHCPIDFARAKLGKPEEIPDISVVWPQMEQLVDEGLVRNIGVSNYRVQDLKEVLSIARIPPSLNQIEFNPYLQQPELNEFCFANGIALAAYSPLGTLNLWPGGPTDRVVEELAAKYSVSTSHILLKYTNQKGFVAITTSRQRERAVDYLSVMSSLFELTTEEVAAIDESGRDRKNRKYWAELF
jgi:diketogulonate reductase-like aldo/keto reductase